MASHRPPVTETELRQRYNTSGLRQIGMSFEAAMQTTYLRAALESGARAAAHASQINRARPHWLTEREP
jgi:hypothetical protein